ncbi:hypothetical protein [Paraburkholderia ferrariae]|uniref:DUF1376 domain-containing protein n=1 Tax=Paraburkholderia ferrariae TaxID=386056 RepID=A0ABU9RYE6_9BURK
MSEAPYPSDTLAKGWRFDLDLERIRQSDTWALTPPDMRPWLLMLWSTAWLQSPCGTLPDNDELIAAHVGMELSAFTLNRDRLMRGWWRAEDGRLYHRVVTERVLEMLAKRDGERDRKAAYRARKAAEKKSEDVPKLSHGTGAGLPRESHGKDDTYTITNTNTNTNTNTTGSNGGSGITRAHDPVDNSERLVAAEISKRLRSWERDERSKAVSSDMPSAPQVIKLAGLGVSLPELRRAYDAAVADREAASDPTPINAGFVRTFVEKHRRPERPRRTPLASMTDNELMAEAKRLRVDTYKLDRWQVIAGIQRAIDAQGATA